MKILKQDLKYALGLAVRIAKPKSTVPILSNVMLSFADNLTISASDLDQSISITVPYTGETGAVCVNARHFTDVVSQLQDNELELQITDKDHLLILRKKGNIKLLACSATNFPSMPILDITEGVVFQSDAFHRLIKTALCGMQEEQFVAEIKKQVDSAQILIDKDKFECYAFDGKRVSRSVGDCEGSGELFIPIAMLRNLVGIISPLEEFTLIEGKNHFFLTTNGLTYSCRQSAVAPVDIKQLWDSLAIETTTSVDANKILASLNLVKTMLSESRTRGSVWAFNKGLTLKAVTDAGEIAEHIPLDTDISGEWGFNTDWLIPVFQQMNGDTKIGIERGSFKIVSSNAAFVVQALKFT